MRFLKVVCVILSYVMIVALLQDYGFYPSTPERLKLLNSQTLNEGKANMQMSKDVLNCFSENDAQSLRALFCLKTQGLTDIDKQILAGFDFFKGSVVSFNEEDLSGYEGESIESGKTTFLERSWRIKDIKTDVGETYEIEINAYIICDEDKSREGISQIIITDDDGKELVIGNRID